jgi:hypothetical protein
MAKAAKIPSSKVYDKTMDRMADKIHQLYRDMREVVVEYEEKLIDHAQRHSGLEVGRKLERVADKKGRMRFWRITEVRLATSVGSSLHIGTFFPCHIDGFKIEVVAHLVRNDGQEGDRYVVVHENSVGSGREYVLHERD